MTDLVALRGFVDALVCAGVADAVVCPGSRSTPLALALRAHPGITVRVLHDERSAGFFALGIAKAGRRPVAVLTTSGTAAANLLPAAVEASLGRVPLVLLTADRPPELRDRGAAQAIDQVRLFGSHAKWFAELPLLDGEEVTARHVRSVAARAVATALAGPAGPVHLNVPFREPLVPDGPLGPRDGEPPAAVITGRRLLADEEIERLARRLASVERGLIVAGPQDDPALPGALGRLAAALDWPILADPLSLARCGPHDRARVVARGDQLLRRGPWRVAHIPDLVLRFGAVPTSKPILTLLEQERPAQVVVDGDGGWREPAILPTTFVHADAFATALALADALRAGERRAGGSRLRPVPVRGHPWLDGWLTADRAADRALRGWLARTTDAGEPFEGAPFAHLADLLPDGGILWAGSSMPVRDMDAWLPAGPRAIRPLASRGANGIDGVVSSALGAAATGTPVALVIGDLALLHDLSGLVAARLHGLSATIVAVNNDGGGIFSFLPQATAARPDAGLPAHFEELFGTPHGIDLGPLVTALGAEHRAVTAGDLRAALETSLGAPGVQVLEVRTDRARNVALHRAAAAAVAAALDELLAADGEAAR
ncbi:MAG: 2-succinyl-5-enolpyruvyl-6-hydroxy-3-cyclohexene-1-carboxylic-acid synthase [Chloroflexota bacterium]